MARPYVSIEHLNDLLQKKRRDRRFLSSLAEELARRNTKRARKLLLIVSKLLAELESQEAEAEDTQSERERESADRAPDPPPEVITGGTANNSGNERCGDGRYVAGEDDAPP